MDTSSDQPFTGTTSGATASSDYRAIASYRDYAQAQRAVDFMSDSEFPVENLRILGHDVTTVEAVIGRLTKGRAALTGASSGAWWGLLIGLLLGMFAVGTAWFGVMVAGLLIGTVWGAIFGFVEHWATGGRRDFTSMSTLAAERYDVVCTPAFAEQAAQLLATMRG